MRAGTITWEKNSRVYQLHVVLTEQGFDSDVILPNLIDLAVGIAPDPSLFVYHYPSTCHN